MNWTQGRREDGIDIVATTDFTGTETFYQIRPPGCAAINFCPCCGKSFRTLEKAQITADRMFPRPLGVSWDE